MELTRRESSSNTVWIAPRR